MSFATQPAFAFGPFVLDVSRRQLLRGGSPIPLTPKAFDTLAVLVRNAHRTVEKDELMRELWPDTFVEEGNLAVQIFALRRALGESTEDVYIQTVSKHGYRFAAQVSVLEEPTMVIMRRTRARVVSNVVEELEPIAQPWVDSHRSAWLPAAAILVALSLVAIVLTRLDLWPHGWKRPIATATAHTVDPEALELYSKGKALWDKRERLNEALQYFQRATQRDAQFALAYAGFAQVSATHLPPASGAEEAARKAIELDPTLSDPHAALGFIRLIHNWDWAGAELELRRARELNPRDATALQWYALYLSLRGRHSEAIAELRRALSLEPASARLHDDLCYVLYFARQYDQAIDQCQNAATIASNRIGTQRALYLIYSKQGHYQQALDAFPAQTRAPLLEKAFAKEGMRGFWKALADITISDRLNSSRAYFIAETYSLMGDTDLALSWLETAADQHNFFMPWIGVNPAFDVLRPHPRFQALLHRVGLK